MEFESIKLSRKLIKTILVESAFRGKTLGRVLMNHALPEFKLTGDILDLGSGSDSASYNRFLKYKDPYTVIYSDLYKKGKNLIKIDLEVPFEIADGSFDYVMCFNTLEHVYNFKNVIKESYRILRNNGVFIGCTPFMHKFHPDPNDYFRYSHQALLKMFEEVNYGCEKLVYVGFGPFTLAGAQCTSLFRKGFRYIFVFFDLLNILMDLLFSKVVKNCKMTYAFSYIFVFKKLSPISHR